MATAPEVHRPNGLPNLSSSHNSSSNRRQDQVNSVNGENLNVQHDVDGNQLDKSPDSKYGMVYTINQHPPWYTSIILGLQHYLTMFGGTISIFFVVTGPLCIDLNLVLKAKMLSTVFFVMGITTLLQSTFGVRLPIIQGTTASLLLPVLSMAQSFETCPAKANSTIGNFTEMVILPRVQMVSGTLMVGSLVQILIGVSGAANLLLRFIGPIVIAPTITLIGISLFEIASLKSEGQWWIALTTSVLICIFTFFLSRLRVPCCARDQEKGWYMKKIAIFKTCPVLLGIGIAWLLCAILTVTNALPKSGWGHAARTDSRIEALTATPWFQFPYPGQWGAPRVLAVGLLGMSMGYITSIVESVGDYFACARLSGAVPPPAFAVNRGITLEGLGCFIAGALGLPIGTTSYSENVGAIGITRVGSRRVVQVAAVFMLLFGIFGKAGALFVSIPDPVFGGVFLVMFGMLAGIGLSNLQFVDMNSPRNLFIIGIALFSGLVIPEWAKKNGAQIATGAPVVDDIFRIILTINMFVGGLLAFVLDLILPGTEEERGIKKWRIAHVDANEETVLADTLRTYDLELSTRLFRRFSWIRFLPLCPTYSKFCTYEVQEDPAVNAESPTQEITPV